MEVGRWISRLLVGFATTLPFAAAAPLPPSDPAGIGNGRFRPKQGQVAALSSDGRLLALSTETSLDVWDLITGSPIYRVKGKGPTRLYLGRDEQMNMPAVFTPDGKHLLTIDEAGVIVVREAATGKAVRNISLPEQKAIPALAKVRWYRPKVVNIQAWSGGSRFVVRADGGAVFTLDPADWSLTYRCETGDDITAVSGDGLRMVFYQRSEVTYMDFIVHDAALDKMVLNGTGWGWMDEAALSFDGALVAQGGYTAPTVWNIKTKAEITLAHRSLAAGGVDHIAFTPDGKTLLAASKYFGNVARWDLSTGKRLADLRACPRKVESMAVSGNGKLLVVLGDDKLIHRFDLTTGKELGAGGERGADRDPRMRGH